MDGIRKHSHLRWYRHGMSKNKSITVDDILYLPFPKIPGNDRWDWNEISKVIDISEVWKHPELPWCRHNLTLNSTCTLSDVVSLNLPNARNYWAWDYLSARVNMEEIRNNPEYPWDKECVTYNPSITVADLRRMYNTHTLDLPKICDRVRTRPVSKTTKYRMGARFLVYNDPKVPGISEFESLDWMVLSKIIDIQEIRDNPDFPWIPSGIFRNKGATLKDIETLSGNKDDWKEFTINTSLQIIRENPGFPWDTRAICNKEGMTIDDFKVKPCNLDLLGFITNIPIQSIRDRIIPLDTFDKKIRRLIVLNKKATLDDILRYTDDWKYISTHINIQIVRDNPDQPWNKEILSLNKGITLDDILHLKLPNATNRWNLYRMSTG